MLRSLETTNVVQIVDSSADHVCDSLPIGNFLTLTHDLRSTLVLALEHIFVDDVNDDDGETLANLGGRNIKHYPPIGLLPSLSFQLNLD